MTARLWGLVPVPVAYRDGLPPRADGSMPAGRCVSTWRGPAIEIREAYRDDAGLLAHELRHAAQWWRIAGLGLAAALLAAPWLSWSDRAVLAAALPLSAFRLLYAWWPTFRLACEAEAYAAQLAMAAPAQRPERRSLYIGYMRRWYGLAVPAEAIAAALDAAARREGGGNAADHTAG